MKIPKWLNFMLWPQTSKHMTNDWFFYTGWPVMWTINGYWEWHHVLLSVVRWKWRLCKFRSALHSIALHPHRQTDMDDVYEISWKGGHTVMCRSVRLFALPRVVYPENQPQKIEGEPDPIKLAIFWADSHFTALMGNDQVTNWQTANFFHPETPDTRNNKKPWEACCCTGLTSKQHEKPTKQGIY